MRYALLALLVGCSAATVTPGAPVTAKEIGFEVEAVSGLGLFAEERVKSRELIAQALSSGDAGMSFVARDQAWALAAEGRNPLTGAACGKPLLRFEARKRWGRELGVIGNVTSTVWCPKDRGCELNVNAWPDDAAARFHLNAPITSEGEPLGALSSAVASLKTPEASDGVGGLGILGSMGKSKPIQEEDLLQVRVWPADHRDRTKVDESNPGFPSLTLGQVQTCLSANDSSVLALIEVSASGAIGRCEADPSDDREAGACICGQLQRAAPAPWLAGKRWSVSVSIDRRDQTTSDRRLRLSGSWSTYLQRVEVPGDKYPHFKAKVEDPSIEAWSTGPSRLATGCFTNAFPEPGHLNSRWAVWFDAVGRPTKVLEQKGYPPLAKELAECVARALRTAQAPCPSRAGLWAMADLHVSAADPNAPPPSLKDLLGAPKQP